MKNASQKLLEIAPSAPDRQVAMMLADKCIELTDAPFRFAINHDIRPPKNLACPLHFDWSRKDRVGIETTVKAVMRAWLTKAFFRGYTVYQTNTARGSIGFPHSVVIARRRAALHQMPKPGQPGYEDGDIPF